MKLVPDGTKMASCMPNCWTWNSNGTEEVVEEKKILSVITRLGFLQVNWFVWNKLDISTSCRRGFDLVYSEINMLKCINETGWHLFGKSHLRSNLQQP